MVTVMSDDPVELVVVASDGFVAAKDFGLNATNVSRVPANITLRDVLISFLLKRARG
jgi:hypothetical protein